MYIYNSHIFVVAIRPLLLLLTLYLSHTPHTQTPIDKMPPVRLTILLALLLVVTIPRKSDGQLEQWCVADEQTSDAELQAAMDWACGKGGANCTDIQENGPCYLPNTLKDHASYAFNSYYQMSKQKGASCYFKGAAITTELDPSHKQCHYEFSP